jgi:hypothetical protein
MNPQKLDPVAHTLGRIVERGARYVIVELADIPANPPATRAQSLTFEVDLLALNDLVINDWVVASWSRNPRRNRETGALQLHGSLGGGAQLIRIATARTMPAHESWLLKAAQQLKQGVEDLARQPDRPHPAPPDISPVLAVAHADGSVKGRWGTPKEWLALPCPLPQAAAEADQPDGYMRIGYVSFTLDSPAEELHIQEMMGGDAVNTLRGNLIQKNNWHAQLQVQLTLTLNGADAINQILLPLLRMFRRAPAQPVINNLLAEKEITALVLQNLSWSTMPGVPNVLRAELTFVALNWRALFPTAASLDDQFCYPLLKLWLERTTTQYNHAPVSPYWNGTLRLYHPSEAWLQQASEFPEQREQYTRRTRDQDGARQLLAWRASAPSALPGFVPFRPDTITADFDGGRELKGDVGRAVVYPVGAGDVNQVTAAPEALEFIRVRDLATAARLARHADTRFIFRKGVRLLTTERNHRWAGLAGALAGLDPSAAHVGGPAIFDFSNSPGSAADLPTRATVIDKGTLASYLGDPSKALPEALADESRQAIRDQIETGGYVFAMRAGSSEIAAIASQPAPELPILAQEPQKESRTAFDGIDLIVEQISASVNNTLVPHQVRSMREPQYQFMGSNQIEYQIEGTIAHDRRGETTQYGADLSRIDQFLKRVNELARAYRGSSLNGAPFGGFVIVDNELFGLMGTRHLLPVSWRVDTIPGVPNALKFSLSLIEFDITQRRLEAMEDLMQGIGEDAPELALESQFDDLLRHAQHTWEFNRRLRAVELYPDMDLPTHSELAQWVADVKADQVWDWANDQPHDGYDFLAYSNGGTGWQWTTDPRNVVSDAVTLLPTDWQHAPGPDPLPPRFADPDFYCAPGSPYGADFVEQVMGVAKDAKLQFKDPYGCRLNAQVGRMMSADQAVPGTDSSIHAAQAKIDGRQYPLPIGASQGQIDNDLYGTSNTPSTSADGVTFSLSDSGGGGTLDGSGPVGQTGPVVPLAGQPAAGTIPRDDSGQPEDRSRRYGPTAAFFARKYGIDQSLFFAQIMQESQWDSRAHSSKGAGGLVQIIPPTAAGLARQLGIGHYDVHDPVFNLNAAAFLMKQLLNQYHGDVPTALVAYNGGPRAVAAYRAGRPYKESRNYVKKVLEYQRTLYHGTVIGPSAAPTPALASTPATTQDDIEREVHRLKVAFNQGFGYKIADLEQYVDDPKLHGEDRGNGGFVNSLFEGDLWGWAVDRRFGTKPLSTPAQRARRFIPTRWVRGITAGITVLNHENVGGSAPLVDVNAEAHSFRQLAIGGAQAFASAIAGPLGGAGVAAYLEGQPSPSDAVKLTTSGKAGGEDGHVGPWNQIQQKYLPQFVHELRARHLNLPLYPIPNRTPGTYANQEAVIEGRPTGGLAPWEVQQSFYDPERHQDCMHDLRESYGQHRLLALYPTFYVAIVDGGRAHRIWRLFDHVYGMLAVTRIGIHRSRENPADTAVVGFSNMFGHLTNLVNETAIAKRHDTRWTWGLEAFQNSLASIVGIDDETKSIWEERRHSLFLRPGARLHVRLGYGSDAARLPICFNGVISEVPIQDGEVQVVALGDGIELLNDLAPNSLQGSTPMTTQNALFGAGLNPRELIMSFMAPITLGESASQIAGSLAGPLLYYNFRNQYGIEHFGRPVRHENGLMDDDEIGINVSNPEYSNPIHTSSAWDNTLRMFQPWRWGGTNTLIGVNVANATPWSLFEVCRKSVPEYLLAIEPFELRSTLFYGKGWFPLHYQYRTPEDPDEVQFSRQDTPADQRFERKPFQQLHLISSDWNLIGNHVRGDATNVVTRVQAIGTYNGWLPGSSDLSNENSFVQELDCYIFDEFQKFKQVASGLYTTVGMKLDEGAKAGAIGGLFGALAGLPGMAIGWVAGVLSPFLFSRRVEDYVAAMVLKDHVKTMYAGALVTIGNGFLKPYDYIAIQDHMSGMNGLAEVRDVTHSMSQEEGFMTAATPDCVARYVDFEGRDLIWWLSSTASHMFTAFMMAKLVGHMNRGLQPWILIRGVRNLTRWLNRRIAKALVKEPLSAKDWPFTDLEQAREAQSKLLGLETEFKAAVRSKNNAKVLAALTSLEEDELLAKVLKAAPQDIRYQIQLQRLIRSIPGSDRIGAAATWLQDGYLRHAVAPAHDLRRAVEKEWDEITDQITAKADGVGGLDAMKALSRKTKDLAKLPAAERELVELIRMRNGLQLQRVATGALKTASEAPFTITALLKDAIGAEAVTSAISSVCLVAVGSLCDYLTRWAAARQCLTLFPLRVYDKEFSAGITGHRGSVPGDHLIGLSYVLDRLGQFMHGPIGHWVAFLPVVGEALDALTQVERPTTAPAPMLPPGPGPHR